MTAWKKGDRFEVLPGRRPVVRAGYERGRGRQVKARARGTIHRVREGVNVQHILVCLDRNPSAVHLIRLKDIRPLHELELLIEGLEKS